VEALQEMKIQTSGMSAEFGRAQAGVFNYVMKSGANHCMAALTEPCATNGSMPTPR
jgi:hypothetical protein